MTRPTFKGYMDNIQIKTGKTAQDFWNLASKKGFVKRGKVVAKHSEILAWLKSIDIGLGHVHASFLIRYLRLRANDPKISAQLKKWAYRTGYGNHVSSSKSKKSTRDQETPAEKFKTIDEYIEAFPENVQDILEKLRSTIRKAAPDAVESISYQMPTYKINAKRLVYFSAWKNHIGFYSIPEGNAAFRKELSPFEGPKGSLRFRLDKPIPYDLVKKIVVFRTKEIQQKKT
jgi:uncharacterized protein YdhG (YjbR/CyaY superfamily)